MTPLEREAKEIERLILRARETRQLGFAIAARARLSLASKNRAFYQPLEELIGELSR